MPNFNDVYLNNYQVLDYGLICKKTQMGSSVSSVRSGCPSQSSFLSFSCHSDMFIKYGALGSFCVKSSVVLDLHHPIPSFSSFACLSLVLSFVHNAEGQPKEQGGGRAVAVSALRTWAVGHVSARAVGAGVAGRVKPLDGGQDVCHEWTAAWLQDNGNPHKKGFGIVGKGCVDLHTFRVDGETFMNSTAGGWWACFSGLNCCESSLY